MRRIARLFLSMAGIGYLPRMPGTWGSAASIPLLYLLQRAMISWQPLPTLIALLLLMLIVSACAVAAIRVAVLGGAYDQPFIVIDELLGMTVSFLPLFVTGRWSWGLILLGFGLFRLFDVWKPLGIRRIDRDDTPLAVVLDDLFAGVLACAVLVVFLASRASSFV